MIVTKMSHACFIHLIALFFDAFMKCFKRVQYTVNHKKDPRNNFRNNLAKR